MAIARLLFDTVTGLCNGIIVPEETKTPGRKGFLLGASDTDKPAYK